MSAPAENSKHSARLPRLTRRWQYLAVVAAGGLFACGFAPVGLPLVSCLSLAVLYLFLRQAPVRQGILTAYLFGLGMLGAGVSWVQVSVHQFGLPYYSFSVSVTALMIALLAVFTALVGWVMGRWAPASGPWRVVAFAAAWTLSEWVRGWAFSGFPWLYAGYAMIDTPLVGFAPVAGVLSMTFLCALVSAAFAEAIRAVSVLRAMVAAVVATGLIQLAGFTLKHHSWTSPAGIERSATLVQGNIEQARKWDPEQLGPTMDLYRTLTEPHLGDALVIWPETAIPALAHVLRDYLTAMDGLARDRGTTLLLGIPIYSAEDGFRNSVIALGAANGRYDKRHLVPFGEYMPFRDLLGPLLRALKIPMSDFRPGPSEQVAITANGFGIGVSICYEDAFSREIRKSMPDAAVLVNVSNDAWFGDSLAPHQHLEIARMRAVEFQRYLLRATNTGISAIIAPDGTVTATLPQFQAGAVSGRYMPMTGVTPFAKFGNLPLLAGLVLLVIGSGWYRHKTK
ncbi:MAG: apolipoprotein N-acyltransferase [Gammaproteobacteria bacterium]|nr:apolipoprotein N-acyltransferase [Gammaproteobacteria bacterium]